MSTLANLTEVLFRLDFDPDTAVYHYRGQTPVSYTHLTLPTNREVEISVVPVSLKKKKKMNT